MPEGSKEIIAALVTLASVMLTIKTGTALDVNGLSAAILSVATGACYIISRVWLKAKKPS